MAKEKHSDFDILIIPQLDHRAPGKHLTPQEFIQAQHDWHQFTIPEDDEKSWDVAVAHMVGGELCVTSTVRIRRSA